MGGISFPLLADFHPKGAMAASYGTYLEGEGTTDRATVLVDADGIVRYASSVTPAGQRDMSKLAELSEGNARDYAKDLPPRRAAPGLESGSVLYVKNNCGFSRKALLARSNLHLTESLPVRNVSEDAAAMARLKSKSPSGQAPALVVGNQVILDANEIVSYLVERCAPL